MGRRLTSIITGRIGSLLILLATLALSGLVFATSPGQPKAQPDDGLPAGAQSTRVTQLADRFASGRQSSAIVVYERADAALTEQDRAAIDTARAKLGTRAVGGQVAPPAYSQDGRAALVVVPLPGDLGNDARATTVDGLRADVRPDLPAGLSAQVTGGAAFGRDIAGAFKGADITLLAATAAVVALLLLITYRSPFLWIVPLAVIGIADQVVAKLLPWVAHLVGERTDASVSGIVSVLVFGAGTDYALLLIARYREELRRTESRRTAMASALSDAAPAIVASAATVILALLTLLFAVLTSNRTLGISAALGVAIALLFGLVVLPATLVCLPRGIFWPFKPKVGSTDPSETGFWFKVARGVGRRPATVLIASTVVLAGLALGLIGTRIGLSQTEMFRTKVESVTAQETLARHYPAGAAQPATVIVNSPAADATVAALQGIDGATLIGRPEVSEDGLLTKFSVQLSAETGTAQADTTITAIRDKLGGALVGGAPAADLDKRDANLRDDAVIAPLVLAVVLIVLIVLLRSLVAPVLLLITVIVSYTASLGAASLVFRLVDMPALDAAVPLLSFLFLVALGVDYNIFLVTRAREETIARGGTQAGMLRALSATGGVITSAGILLAAVFAVLGVLPVVVLTQIGIIVGVGVLLDTLLVRTIVVPALALLIGERFWWPARPASPTSPSAPAGGATADLAAASGPAGGGRAGG